ncbi:ATP-binding cassette domain-containing protein [Marinomonas epiphytica]
MPFFQVNKLTHQFSNGELLFQDLSCVMTHRCTALMGRNGSGKSIFASYLSGESLPLEGKVILPSSVAIFRQEPFADWGEGTTIAQYLGKADVLKAIEKIASGDCDSKWFDLIGDEWDLPYQLSMQLAEIGLPSQLDFPCALLSGGQKAKLRLWNVFNSGAGLLVLDEPSNHLDLDAKRWLIERITGFKGGVLLITHDRLLLRECEQFWTLSQLGLEVFQGTYDCYVNAQHERFAAIDRKIGALYKEQRKLKLQNQRNKEKAQQRTAQGKKQRKTGSQPKVLLDKKKDKATASLSSMAKSEQRQISQLQAKMNTLSQQKEMLVSQKVTLKSEKVRANRVVSLQHGVLPYGSTVPVNMQVFARDKVHLKGPNASGKSTLLKLLAGKYPLETGELYINTEVFYLDQFASHIDRGVSVLENIMFACSGMQEQTARTLLASIGFVGDKVFEFGNSLSGGEKMKLSMLIVSNQENLPFLLLDEPDNHLDLESKELLAEALSEYKRGFVLVSHDDDFVRESGVMREVELL